MVKSSRGRPPVFEADGLREQILDAAEDLLERYGIKKMTMDDLAQRAGVGKGTLYLHFSGKNEVALSVIDRINLRLRARLDEYLDADFEHGDRVLEMIAERVMFRFDAVRRHTTSLDELYACLRPELMERKAKYLQEEAALLASALEKGVEAGVFEIEDIDETARLMLLATNCFLPYSLSPAELGKRKELDVRVRLLAGLLVNAVRK